jgi:uncharacterized Tic20 family protein
MKIVEFIFKITGLCIAIINFLRILLSPFLIGTVFGGLIYLAFKSTFSLVTGIFFSLVSLLIGIFWAINVWKKTGTTQYIGRLHASRDLDDIFTKKK